MQDKSSLQRITCILAVALMVVLAGPPQLLGGTLNYTQTNLVSNSSATPANFTDPNLINPWGNVSNGGSPFWVSDQGTGLSTLYDASTTPPGMPQSLIVTIPGRSVPLPDTPLSPKAIAGFKPVSSKVTLSPF